MATTATTTRPASRPRPAFARYREHVLGQPCSGSPKTCQACFDLERDASAESYRFGPIRKTAQRG